jgi:hypothetical protein
MMRRLMALLVASLVISGCLAQSSRQFAEGTEPEVEFSEISLLESVTEQARITLSVRNPNEWPITLVRLRVRVSGSVRGENQPEYGSVRLEVPGRETRQLDVAMELIDVVRSVPDEVAPEDRPFPVERARKKVAEIRGQLFFSTPQGELTVYLKDRLQV